MSHWTVNKIPYEPFLKRQQKWFLAQSELHVLYSKT